MSHELSDQRSDQRDILEEAQPLQERERVQISITSWVEETLDFVSGKREISSLLSTFFVPKDFFHIYDIFKNKSSVFIYTKQKLTRGSAGKRGRAKPGSL